MANGYRKLIANSIASRASQKLGRVFYYLSGPKRVHPLQIKWYVMIVKDDFTPYSYVYFPGRHFDVFDTLRSVWLMCVRMVRRRR